jgi:radical SAM superfamily enzyme YgiQ (UPF0313 family)
MWMVMGTRFRMRSAKSVFDEVKLLYETYGINYFKIMDDTFTFNRQRAVDFCEMIISSGIKAYFETPNGISVKTLDRELIKTMREAGFIIMSVAVESGSDYIRNKIMGKGTSKEQIYNAFEWCREFGIKTNMFIIVGMPEETEETFAETRKLVEEIDADRYGLNSPVPTPGTKLYEQCVKDNLLLDKNAWTWTGEQKAVMGQGSDISKVFGFKTNPSAEVIHIKPYALSAKRMSELKLSLVNLAAKKLFGE